MKFLSFSLVNFVLRKKNVIYHKNFMTNLK